MEELEAGMHPLITSNDRSFCWVIEGQPAASRAWEKKKERGGGEETRRVAAGRAGETGAGGQRRDLTSVRSHARVSSSSSSSCIRAFAVSQIVSLTARAGYALGTDVYQ